MKKMLVLIFIVLSVVYLTLSIPEINTPKKISFENIKGASVTVNKEKAKVIKNEITPIVKKVIPEQGKQEEHSQISFIKRLKEEKIIQARVEDGYAIAYGDVLLGEVDADSMEKPVFVESTPMNLWDSNKIHYYIEPDLANKMEVEKAIEIMNTTTVMEFIPFDSLDVDGIVFRTGKNNCYSYLGKIGGIQPIMLSTRCGVTEILHEILHALGFIHEQSRSDRDEYIDIIWDNIIPEYYSQFQIVPESYMLTVEGTDFDFSSIMLYRPDSFSKEEGRKTMQPKGAGQFNLKIENFSKIDIERIDRIYRK